MGTVAAVQCSGLVAEDNTSWHRQLQRKRNKMMKHFLVAHAFLVLVSGTPLPQDPNDEVEVISGPVSSNEGDYDYNGFGGFGDFIPRVRVFVIPVQESDYDYADSSTGTGDIGGFLGILKSILGARLLIFRFLYACHLIFFLLGHHQL